MKPAHFGVYAATKDAIRSLSRAASIEWGPDRIRVNVMARLPTRRTGSPIASVAVIPVPGLGVPLGRVGGRGERYRARRGVSRR